MLRKNRFSPGTLFLCCLCLLFGLILCTQVDAKRRSPAPSPVKISDVVISPEPFLIGKSPVTFNMLVEVPSNLNGANVLEVSALISSPTRRNMSFVAHRQVLDQAPSGSRSPFVPVVLVWDGKDQDRRLVPDGSYYYEIRAKLMEDEGDGPRTKVVSHRVQGTLDVLAYAGEVLPPVPPEPELPDEVPDGLPGETLGDMPGEADSPEKEGELPAEDVPVVEEGLKATDEPANGDVPQAEEGLVQDTRVPSPEIFPEALPEIQNSQKADEHHDPGGMSAPSPEIPPETPQDPAKPTESVAPAH